MKPDKDEILTEDLKRESRNGDLPDIETQDRMEVVEIIKRRGKSWVIDILKDY